MISFAASHILVAFISLASFAVAQDSSYTQVGCFSSIPSGFVDKGYYKWQSYSYCQSECTSAGYPVFALYNAGYCYCGSEIPSSDETDSSDCSSACLGFGSDTCGGSDAYQVFYVGSSNTISSEGSSASGTASSTTKSSSATTSGSSSASSTGSSASSDSSSSTSTASDTSASSTSTATGTSSSSSSSTTHHSSSSSTSASQSSSSSASSADSSASSSSAAASATGESKHKSSGVSGGAIAGIVIGVLAALAIIGAVLVFLKKRRDSNRYESYSPNVGPHGFKDFSSPSDPGVFPPPPIPTKNQPYVDQRLNPSMLGERRLSEGSLADARDYSRKILRVANPDE